MTAWLLTWFWQGVVLALGVAVVLKGARRLNAATKHLIWCGALAALGWLGWSALPGVSVTALKGCATAVVGTGATGLVAAGGTGLQPCLAAAEPVLYVPSAPDTILSILLGIWAAVALVNLVRLLPGLHAVYALRDRCRPMPSDVESQLPLWLEARERGRRADLMICDAVPGATVLGLQRPSIAVPSSLVEALTPDELDQVVLHEHAHVQRRDDWLRLAEQLVMSVMCVHPAALFIARQLNREREMACDEWVVDRTGLPKAYARCLAHAAEVRNRIGGRAVLIPALLGGRHELLRRVDRLLAINKKTGGPLSLTHAAAAVCAIAVATGYLQGVRAAEIASIVFPLDRVQQVAWMNWAKPLRRVRGVQEVRGVQVQQVQGVHRVREVQQERGVQGVRQAREAAAAEVQPADFPSLLAGRSLSTPEAAFSAGIAPIAPFAPIAPAPIAPAARIAPIAPNAPDWRMLATPGVEIAAAAKKTSVGIATAFGRAGVSLARRF